MSRRIRILETPARVTDHKGPILDLSINGKTTTYRVGVDEVFTDDHFELLRHTKGIRYIDMGPGEDPEPPPDRPVETTGYIAPVKPDPKLVQPLSRQPASAQVLAPAPVTEKVLVEEKR